MCTSKQGRRSRDIGTWVGRVSNWLSVLEGLGVVLADGAMGTMLFEHGLEFGDPPEVWNVEHPDRVRDVHKSYLDAGSRLLLTNTFGGNRFRLGMHEIQSRVTELNLAGAQQVRAEIDAYGGLALAAGDIGPSGDILAPLGTLEYSEAVEGFMEQASALIDGGVDVIWIETMSDLKEVRAAMDGVRLVSTQIPIITTMTFDTRGHTMMGVSPEEAVNSLSQGGAVAVGANCGNGPEEIVDVISKMRRVSPNSLLVAKSNAGVPELVDGQAVYGASPNAMADYTVAARAAGARLIGGCCGSTPSHVEAMAKVLVSE